MASLTTASMEYPLDTTPRTGTALQGRAHQSERRYAALPLQHSSCACHMSCSSSDLCLLVQIEHSPDWGSSFDTWTALFLLHYRALRGDPDGFIAARYQLLRNGFAHQAWQVVDDLSGLSGAFWQTWIPGKGFGPSGFVRGAGERALWLCDTGTPCEQT